MSNPITRRWEQVRSLGAEVRRLKTDVAALQRDVEECRRLNERLADVLDVVVELLVPAVDRDEDRLRSALERL